MWYLFIYFTHFSHNNIYLKKKKKKKNLPSIVMVAP